ncbi:hypothetical protein FIBSPDRAFT_318289 [Athelia psychrophila]|uniref:Uncharacterized protein n=1 Tax=Athelia psychrophila TaxID=1759441 RepID=A0A167WTI1_9AGAM|nr:hypothetical protein FIBSPDRAFT_318289 [Fibularhizoctonia sp. CBS 109695]
MRGRRGRKGAKTGGTTRKEGFEAGGHRWDPLLFQMGALWARTAQRTPFRPFLLLACSHDADQDGNRPCIESRTCLLTHQQPSSLPPLLRRRVPIPGCRLPQQIQMRLLGLQCPSGSGWGWQSMEQYCPHWYYSTYLRARRRIGVRHPPSSTATSNSTSHRIYAHQTCAALPRILLSHRRNRARRTPETWMWCRCANDLNKHSLLPRPRPRSRSALRIPVLVTHGREAESIATATS